MPKTSEDKRNRMFNRTVVNVPAPHRFAVDTMFGEAGYESRTDMYRALIIEGLKTKHPKLFKRLEQDWKDHVKSCIDSGESSDYYITKPVEGL